MNTLLYCIIIILLIWIYFICPSLMNSDHIFPSHKAWWLISWSLMAWPPIHFDHIHLNENYYFISVRQVNITIFFYKLWIIDSVFACQSCPGSGSGCFIAMSNDIATARGIKSNQNYEDTAVVDEEYKDLNSNLT